MISCGRLVFPSIRYALAIYVAIVSSIGFSQGVTESKNMALVGYNDLQGRTAYQPTIQKQGDRWIAYVGHHGDYKMNPLTGKMENNGTSIIDVTDPKKPKYLKHIPGEEGKAEQGELKWYEFVLAPLCRRPIKINITC